MNPWGKCLVEKRDGRLEPLRATKLARSLCLALDAGGEPAPEFCFELTTAVLRRLAPARMPAGAVSSAALADAARAVLLAQAGPAVAAAYSGWGARQDQRRRRAAAGDRLAST